MVVRVVASGARYPPRVSGCRRSAMRCVGRRSDWRAFLGAEPRAARLTVYEKRVVRNHQVDLTPLFDWWQRQAARNKAAGELDSCRRIAGKGTAYGWLVRGTIEGRTGSQYFLLRNRHDKNWRDYASWKIRCRSWSSKELQNWASPNSRLTTAGNGTLMES